MPLGTRNAYNKTNSDPTPVSGGFFVRCFCTIAPASGVGE